jgi:hypothetical protein
MVVLLAVTLAVQFRWIRGGRVRAGLVFVAGVVVIGALWMGGAPPDWFEGGGEGFGIAVGFLLGAWVSSRGEARGFGRPLFLGLGLALFGLNLVELIRKVG